MSPQPLDTEVLTQLVDTVLEQLLGAGAEVMPVAATVEPSSDISVCVHIAGEWNGAVLLWPSEGFARHAAGIVFRLADHDVSVDDVHDALAELNNVIAGNLKSLLPGPSTLSLPSVTRGRRHEVFVHRAELVARLEFTCLGEPVCLLVLEGVVPARRALAASC
jgi:chemotaxis protein CheX